MGTEGLSAYLNKYRRDIQRAEKLIEQAPRIIGNECVKVVKDNFRLQGYDNGNGVTGWDKRSPKTDAAYDRGKTVNAKGKQSKYRTGKNATYKGSVYSSSKPLLDQTGNLKNSVNYLPIGKTVSIGVLRNNKGPVLKYAQHMNEGGKGVPERKFMPDPNEDPNSKMLKNIRKKFKFELDKALKSFETL